MALIRSIFYLIWLSLFTFVHFASADDAIEVLERAAEHGIDAVRSDVDRAIIQFWMDAGRVNDDELQRCTVAYLRLLQDKILSDMQCTQMTNVTRLYEFSEHDLLSSCGVWVAELAKEIIRSLEIDQIAKLDEPAREFDLWFSRETQTETTFKSVAESMMWAMGADNCLIRASFISTWNRGPCYTVLNRVAQPDMQPLVNYVNMVNDIKVHPLHLGNEVSLATIGAVSIIRCCEYFRSERALIQAWVALQESDSYHSIKDQLLALMSNNVNRH